MIVYYLTVINKSVRFEAKLLHKWRFNDANYALVHINIRFGIGFLTLKSTNEEIIPGYF